MSRKMLVVVDYQNDFVDGALGFPGANELDSRIADKVMSAYHDGAILVATADTHQAGYLYTREGRALPVPHCIKGTPGWELYGKTGELLDKLPHILVRKATFGAAPSDITKLPDDVDEIEFVGLVTNMCVVSNVCCFQARYPEAQITVNSKLVDSFDKDLHNKTLDVLRGLQVNVI